MLIIIYIPNKNTYPIIIPIIYLIIIYLPMLIYTLLEIYFGGDKCRNFLYITHVIYDNDYHV